MRRLLLCLGLVLLGSMVSAPTSGAAVYWGNISSIGIANLDGSSPLPSFSPGLAGTPVCDLAANENELFWAETWSIGRIDLNDATANQQLISGLFQPCAIAIDGSHVYWASFERNGIGRANLDGSEANPQFIGGEVSPHSLAVRGGHIYWSERWGGIARANLDGTEVDRSFIEEAFATGLAVEDRHIYWSRNGAIARANLDGKEVETDFVTDAGEAASIASDGRNVYWTANDPGTRTGIIGAASVDGMAVNRRLISTPYPNPSGLALNTRPAALLPSQPSWPFSFVKLSRDKRKGVVYLAVEVPARGEMTVTSPALGWKMIKGPPPPPALLGSFRWKLKLWPGRASAASKRIRRQLRRTGRAPITLRVSYQEEGKFPVSAEKKLTLLKPKRPGHAGP